MPLQLSASLNLTGSFNLSGSMSSTQTLNITSSYSLNSATSSYISSSNITGTVLSSSYSLSSSFAPINTNITASWSTNSLTSSYVTLAQSASYYGGTVISASYSLSSSFAPINTNITASWSNNSLTASSINFTASNATLSQTSSYLTTTNNYTLNNLTASNISSSNTLSASNVWFGNSMIYVETMSTGSLTLPDITFTSTATSGSDVMMKIDTTVLTGSSIGLHINASGSQTSYAISASSGTIIGTIFSGSTFNGSFTGSNFGTASWSNNSITSSNALTASSLITSNNYTVSTLNVNSSGSTSASTNGSLSISGQNTKGGSAYHDFLYITNTSASAVNPNKYFRQDNTGNFEIVNSAYNNTIFILTDSGSLQLPVAQSGNITQLRNTGAGLKISGLSIFDDGNPHIHNTTPSTNLWVNVSGSGNVIINGQTGASGGVCIGSTSSRGKLDVNGSVNYDQGTFYYYANIYGGTSTGTIPISVYASDRMAASEFDARSDKRLKKDIRVIDTQMALQFVKTSKPVLYKWNTGVDNGDKSGYIAQDIIKIGFPHLVSGIPNDDIKQETDSDGYTSPDKVQFSMNYDQVVPLLDVALKNALQRIEQLEARLAVLESKTN